jgi:predicted HicB family RNase H-like nuclease
MMEYKGYLGRVEFDDEAGVFHGEVINTRDVITFQGQSVAELKKALTESVDDYLAFCEERREALDKPFSGQFVTRISPELHRQVHVAAAAAGKSLNAWVTEQLHAGVQRLGLDMPAGGETAAKIGRGTGRPKSAGKSGRTGARKERKGVRR